MLSKLAYHYGFSHSEMMAMSYETLVKYLECIPVLLAEDKIHQYDVLSTTNATKADKIRRKLKEWYKLATPKLDKEIDNGEPRLNSLEAAKILGGIVNGRR